MTWCTVVAVGVSYSSPKEQMKTKKVVIFTDGAAEPNPGPAAIGATIKDEKGRLITGISQSIGCATNNQAEYRAIIAALEKAIGLGAKHVEVNSDSELVVKQISGRYRVKKAALKPLYQKVKQLQGLLESFTITHIPRRRNKEADKLTRKALVSVSSTFVYESRRLIIRLTQTSDEEKDRTNLHKLIATLRDFPGTDEVKLSMTDGERVINLRLSNMYINYCPELHQRLVELVGEDGLSLESVNLEER